MIYIPAGHKTCTPYDQMANGFYMPQTFTHKKKNDNINYKVLTHHNNMTNVLAFGQTLSATLQQVRNTLTICMHRIIIYKVWYTKPCVSHFSSLHHL